MISFEFPPAVAIGGIGAYAQNLCEMLVDNKISVCVFCAGQASTQRSSNLVIHRFDVASRTELAAAIVDEFSAEHQADPFCVIEGPDIGPESDLVAKKHPEIARVVRLHTPSYLVARVGFEKPSVASLVRFFLGGLRRGNPKLLQTRPVVPEADERERENAHEADEVVAICKDIGDIVTQDWSLDPEKVNVVPNPFVPTQQLLEIPLPTSIRSIGFLGRLEPRKGILEFAAALPRVIRSCPELKVHFIGPSWPYGLTDMKSWILKKYPEIAANLIFHGGVDASQVPGKLKLCDCVVLPSRWENFPYACAEAMASGRPVIGSEAGGMAEMIATGTTGLLVPPRKPQAIAEAVLKLLKAPEQAIEMGRLGRESIQQMLSFDAIYPQHIASYQRAITRAAVRNQSTDSCQ